MLAAIIKQFRLLTSSTLIKKILLNNSPNNINVILHIDDDGKLLWF